MPNLKTDNAYEIETPSRIVLSQIENRGRGEITQAETDMKARCEIFVSSKIALFISGASLVTDF